MWFIAMLVFQLSGALLLLLNSMKGSENDIIKNCFPGSNIVTRDDNDNCVIDKKKLQESAYKVYLNRIAFLDLAIGYMIAIFSPTSTQDICEKVLWVLVGTVGLLYVESKLSCWLSEKNYSQDKIVPYSELEQNDVDTAIMAREIDDIFDK